jgi:NAD(P)-dependent dehydrogenase (short-subunit alcohol dehydrogenase family)
MALNPPLRHWEGRRVWLVGASTGIGRATASALHARGARVIVSARNEQALHRFVVDHPGAEALVCDATEADALREAAARLLARHGQIDLAVYCAGYYHAMQATGFDLADALRHQQVNYVGALHWLNALLPALLRQSARGQPAHLSLVASVAGYRGLPQALAYGPTKAALINLAETLYLDLARHGVGVSLVNPGFVETPLTAQNQFRMPALLQPEQAAAAIVAGWEAGRFEIHFPRRFTLALKALRALPDRWYFSAVQRWVHP